MIKNLWNIIHLWCGNGHSEPVEMILRPGPNSSFYSCPKYYPEYRTEHDKACKNHIGPYDLEKFVDHIGDIILEGIKTNTEVNLKGYKWKYKSFEFTILKHNSERIDVLVLNKKAVKL